MTKTISKKELKKADQFTQTGRNVLEQIIQNQKMVLTVVVLVLLSGVGYIAWDKTRLNKEIAAQEEYYSIEKNYLKIKEGFEKAESEAKAEAKAEDQSSKEKSKPATGDLVKDYGSEVDGWTKLIEAHASSKAAAMAALQLSQLYLKYEKPKEALQILSKTKAQQSSDNLLGAMVFHSYAKLLANQGQCQEAVGVWETLEKKKNLHFLTEQAQLDRALCLESMGQTEKAEGIYKEVAATKNETTKGAGPRQKSPAQKSAEKYLRYLKLKKSMVTPS